MSFGRQRGLIRGPHERSSDAARPEAALDRPDAVTIDALARLQLTARRLGCRLRLRHASPELRELVAFMGLRRSLRFGS